MHEKKALLYVTFIFNQQLLLVWMSKHKITQEPIELIQTWNKGRTQEPLPTMRKEAIGNIKTFVLLRCDAA